MERWLKRQGFNLHAGVVIGAHNREGLERLCRYVARPPLSSKRMYIHPPATTKVLQGLGGRGPPKVGPVMKPGASG
jgi:hypothetical protein